MSLIRTYKCICLLLNMLLDVHHKFCGSSTQCNSQCQHQRTRCLTYTVRSVVCNVYGSRPTNSPKSNFHSDSPGSTGLGTASHIISDYVASGNNDIANNDFTCSVDSTNGWNSLPSWCLLVSCVYRTSMCIQSCVCGDSRNVTLTSVSEFFRPL